MFTSTLPTFEKSISFDRKDPCGKVPNEQPRVVLWYKSP